MVLAHSPSDLEQIYQRRFAGQSEYRLQVWRVLVDYFARWIPSDATVLDLGCGYCEFINQVEAARKYAMDLNPEVANRAAPAIEILEQDCSEIWAVPDNTLDTVFTSNFFEHLPTKAHLERTLAEAYRCLKNGGRLIAMGPNIKYAPGEYWDFFDHYLPLTELSMTEVLEKCGFQVEAGISRFLPYTMSQGRKYPLWCLRTYLALPWTWRFFGKQFLVVARKSK
jgi:SAM-dependent methyltransferase